MVRYVVIEIDRHGAETPDDVNWPTREEAEEERHLLARTARLCWPALDFRYEVREVQS
jgi:hypothetical protein